MSEQHRYRPTPGGLDPARPQTPLELPNIDPVAVLLRSWEHAARRAEQLEAELAAAYERIAELEAGRDVQPG